MWLIVTVVVLLIVFAYRPTYTKPEVLRGILSDEECEYIKTKVAKKLKASTVGDDFVEDTSVRISETAWLSPEDPVVKSIIDRFSLDPSVCENLQVVRYVPGGFYKPHQDADVEHVNRRKHTFIFVLNDEYEGGATAFPVLQRAYKLNKGDVLSFDTLDSWGRVPREALHCGEPVVSGEKWIANLWIRQTSYA